MNEFEDLVDMLQIEQPDENSEMVIETICETNDEGEVVCETITGDSVVMSELQLPSDQERDEIDQELDQELQTMFDRYFAPIYDALSFVNVLNPYDYIFQVETSADDSDVLVELNVDAPIENGGVDFYDDEDVEQVYFMELSDASDVVATMENDGDGIVFWEVEDIHAVPCSTADHYFTEDRGYDQYYNGEYEYHPYDGKDELDFGDVTRWQEQVFGELVLVVLLFVLIKIVLFCRRSRSRQPSDRTTPLLTVAVEQQETTDADTGSYTPPKATIVKKVISSEKLDKEPYIVFI